jgi:hypothetical protein
MKLAFRAAAWLHLFPLAVIAALSSQLRLAAPPCLVLGLLNSVAASRPSLWKLVLWLDVCLYVLSAATIWPIEPPLRWVLLGSDAAILLLIVGSAIRTFVFTGRS